VKHLIKESRDLKVRRVQLAVLGVRDYKGFKVSKEFKGFKVSKGFRELRD
jgi:hypothetical protein